MLTEKYVGMFYVTESGDPLFHNFIEELQALEAELDSLRRVRDELATKCRLLKECAYNGHECLEEDVDEFSCSKCGYGT